MSVQHKGKLRKVVFKTVKKATTVKVKPPKEKHLQAILSMTYRKGGSEEVLRGLVARFNKKNWSVVLKSLVIIHKCFEEGDESFINRLKGKGSSIFDLQFFLSSAPQTHTLTVFIKKYAIYLEEVVSVFNVLGYEFTKEKSAAVKDLSDEDFLEVIPKLQSQINALCNCRLKLRVSNYPLLSYTYRQLLKDSFVLYTMLVDALQNIEERFASYQKKEAVKCASIYRLYIKEAAALEKMYSGARSMFNDLPNVRSVDTEKLKRMESQLEGMDENDHLNTGEILNDDDDDVMGTVSNFGVFEEDGGSEESSSEDVAPQQDDFF
eukprot:TRINITY_DN3444_c0_g1_i2.p2 TRINITY_DN3444_c0_g1~~TRINITY_DN3444_c0_g1_i2.p2  ORF type:complete len:321 (-),score=79.23 TRINITY_DN3444_c0_g1_i2:1071-2033(-)